MGNPDFSSQDEITSYQNLSLKKLLNYLDKRSPFYSEYFKTHKINIDSIKSVKDLTKIPVVTKDQLQEYNMEFLCVDKRDVVEYCTTSGTMGNPVTVALTENDLSRLAKNELESFTCTGLTNDDVILLMLSLDRMFMAGIAYYLGARDLGAGIIRGGPANFPMQLELIKRMKPTVLVAVPTFINGLVYYARENKVNLNDTSVKKIICIGENIREANFSLNALGKKITESWNVELFSTYASTEQQTAFTECGHGIGGHHHADMLIFEILDEAGNQLSAGFPGELVITTLGVEGMPLLRYKTGDICAFFDEPCACGRVTVRLGPVIGRKQQMIKYNGTTLYPQALFNILNSLESIRDYIIILEKNELGSDHITIFTALRSEDKQSELLIKHALQSALRVVPELRFTTLSEIQKLQVVEGKRKINKLLDNRNSQL